MRALYASPFPFHAPLHAILPSWAKTFLTSMLAGSYLHPMSICMTSGPLRINVDSESQCGLPVAAGVQYLHTFVRYTHHCFSSSSLPVRQQAHSPYKIRELYATSLSQRLGCQWQQTRIISNTRELHASHFLSTRDATPHQPACAKIFTAHALDGSYRFSLTHIYVSGPLRSNTISQSPSILPVAACAQCSVHLQLTWSVILTPSWHVFEPS